MYVLTDERETLGNTAQLCKVNSCCQAKLHFAELFTNDQLVIKAPVSPAVHELQE